MHSFAKDSRMEFPYHNMRYDFLYRARRLTYWLLDQSYAATRPNSSQMFYGRHHELMQYHKNDSLLHLPGVDCLWAACRVFLKRWGSLLFQSIWSYSRSPCYSFTFVALYVSLWLVEVFFVGCFCYQCLVFASG